MIVWTDFNSSQVMSPIECWVEFRATTLINASAAKGGAIAACSQPDLSFRNTFHKYPSCSHHDLNVPLPLWAFLRCYQDDPNVPKMF
uniref:Uncharacterized protein n=1 Tax=Physcomitrium patens TaxID=3218 RepID=A0A2K1L823_PHYPA|nr:hypothetical protein PHYPA_000613 [Physcomitrium patens]